MEHLCTRIKPAMFRGAVSLLLFIMFFFWVLCPASAFPNGTETIITAGTDGSSEKYPAIYGDYIAWVNKTDPVYIVLDLLDLTSGELLELPVTDSSVYTPDQPSIYEDSVVWHEYDGSGTARIARYNIPGATIQDSYSATYEFSTPEYTYPKIYGNTIVWQNYNSTNSDWDIIVVRDGTASTDLILYSANNEKHPSIYGNFIVYENWTDASHASVWRFSLIDNTSSLISDSSDQETYPQVSADRIVWEARNITDIKSHIVVWENGGITRLTPEGVSQEKPAMNGDRIVVEDYRRSSSIPDVYTYEYSNQWTEKWVAPNTYGTAQYTPAIWNNRIVWEDTRSGFFHGGTDSDIYLFTLGSSDACPVADFSPSENSGPDPSTVTFSDHSAGSPILYRIWNYSDGTTSYPLEPAGQIFSGTGIYHARLTVGNGKCRNVTPAVAKYDIYVDTPPDAGFTATPLAGFAPLAVQFTDISGGDPTSWTWDFGDGSVSHVRSPRHTYTTAGQTYTVALTVNNTFAAMTPDTGTKTDYIRTFLGATGTATTPLQGITVIPRYGGWFLLYNATILPDMVTPGPTVLTAFYPGSAGWQNITFMSDDAIGFSDTFGNGTYMGNLSQVIFQTEDITASGVSPAIGTGWGVNYRLETATYPSSASVSTEIWENTTAADRVMFRLVIIGSNFIENSNGIAYTARIAKNGLHLEGNATINMSVDRSWLGGKEANTYVIGYGINNDGNTVGSVTPARYLFNDGTLDYFEADVPEYFTTFGIAPLSGSGNPFQLITLSVTSHVNPPAQNVNPSPESDSSIPGGGTVAAALTTIPTTTSTPTPTKVLLDPGKSAKVYTNAQGVVSQATLLTSTDGRAIISLAEGVVAKDARGKSLTEITIKTLPSENLPKVPSGSIFTFAGMAYEIGPDGATFSPPMSLTFNLAQVHLGKDYTVKMFDKDSGTWQDLPATYDAAAGTVTVEASRLCCFALFTGTMTVPPMTVATPLPLPAAPQVKAQPPSSAVSIFLNMVGWAANLVMNNLVILVSVIIVAMAVFLIIQDRYPGSGR
jgi:PKD repeat protein